MDKMRQIRRIVGGTWLLLFYAPSYGSTPRSMPTIYSFQHPTTTEVDSITLLSDDVACRGGDPILTVTGQDVRWYADPEKKVLLANGNTYHSASLEKTTTFYLTQKINGIESDVKAITIEIVEAVLVDLKTTPASCGKNDGSLIVTGKGGTEKYPVRFKLNEGPLQTTSTFKDLAPGTYKLTLQAAKCFGSIDVTIGQQPSPIIAKIDSVAPRCGQNDGSLRIAAYCGNGALSYSLNGSAFSTNNRFDSLTGGVYTVIVRDQSLCTVSQQVFLRKSIALELNKVEIVPTSCGQPNGKVNLAFAEGNGAISFSISGRPPQASRIFENLQAGTYQVSATDEDGCVGSQVVVVNDSQGPTIVAVHSQQPTCNLSDGQLSISVAGPRPHFYSLDSVNFQQDSSFRQLAPGKYVITVKDDSGCVVQSKIDLDAPCSSTLSIPSAFTPNEDGINDAWTIFCPVPTIEIEEVKIFSRWGEVVYISRPGTLNSGSVIWDGKYNGQVVRGVFAYRILAKLPGRQIQLLFGQVTVL